MPHKCISLSTICTLSLVHSIIVVCNINRGGGNVANCTIMVHFLTCLQLERNLSGAVLSALSEVESSGVEPDQTDSLVELVSTSVGHLLRLPPASSNEITEVAQVSSHWLKYVCNIMGHLYYLYCVQSVTPVTLQQTICNMALFFTLYVCTHL